MKKEEIKKILEERLNEKLKNTTRTIASLRREVVYEAKEEGLIEDYHWTKNRNSKSDRVIYFGSCVGFDSMYSIVLKKEEEK